jgi:adenosylmethionine-8-amino-7-oxononanoate aminotransferase
VTTTPIESSPQTYDADALSASAREHLWMHFTRMSSYADSPVPTIVRGEGARIFDSTGRSYLDGLAGLFVVNAGHGRKELAEVAYRQASQLAFFPLWSYAHPQRSSWPTDSRPTRRVT